MKSASKIVAVMLLLVFSVGTAFADLPCQSEKQASMHCGPNCPMMVMMHHRGAREPGRDVNAPSCCKMSSHPSVPATAQMVTERSVTCAIESDEQAGVAVPPAQRAKLNVAPDISRRNPLSRAALCTFLI